MTERPVPQLNVLKPEFRPVKSFTQVNCGGCKAEIYKSDTLDPQELELASNMISVHFEVHPECQRFNPVWKHQ